MLAVQASASSGNADLSPVESAFDPRYTSNKTSKGLTMDARAMTVRLRITEHDFNKLHRHLFTGDNGGHAAVLAVGVGETPQGVTLLVNAVFLAVDGSDYVAQAGYHSLDANFIARAVNYCADRSLGYITVHNHGGDDRVAFSSTDLASQDRGYPALRDILRGGPVGALVMAKNATSGRVWFNGKDLRFDHVVVVGASHRRFTSGYRDEPLESLNRYARQSLIFGDVGQAVLSKASVGVIGLGGAGSLVNQLLARLGVGRILGIDFDWVELSNIPRIVGSVQSDAVDFFGDEPNPKASKKVTVAKRVAEAANPNVEFIPIAKDVTMLSAALSLRECDYLFLCADKMQARLVFNTAVNQYLIPGFQVGAKVTVDRTTGRVTEPFMVSRPVYPGTGGGCMLCNELIPASKLQEEALSEAERKSQRYVDDEDVHAPSVVTMNAVASADAVNTFMYSYLGLANPGLDLRYQIHRPRERRWIAAAVRDDEGCPHCGDGAQSCFGRGDSIGLPCRLETEAA